MFYILPKFQRSINNSVLLLHRNSQGQDISDIKRVKKSNTAESCLTSAGDSEATQTEKTTTAHLPQPEAQQCNFLVHQLCSCYYIVSMIYSSTPIIFLSVHTFFIAFISHSWIYWRKVKQSSSEDIHQGAHHLYFIHFYWKTL